MRHQAGKALIDRIRLCLGTTGIFALALLVVVGLLAAPQLWAQAPAGQSPATQSPAKLVFDVASIKLNKSGDQRSGLGPQPGGRFVASNTTLGFLIRFAYQLKGAYQVSGAPDWSESEHFDVGAKVDGVQANLSMEQMRLMLQSLLADRFKMMVRHETRQLPVYALTVAKAGKMGPGLQAHSGDCFDFTEGAAPPAAVAGGLPPVACGGIGALPINQPGGSFGAHLVGTRITMSALTGLLTNFVDRIVIDRTGLDGTFDTTMDFTFQPDASTADASAPPSIFTALQEQLGLKLESTTGPVDVIVLDHVEQPSEN